MNFASNSLFSTIVSRSATSDAYFLLLKSIVKCQKVARRMVNTPKILSECSIGVRAQYKRNRNAAKKFTIWNPWATPIEAKYLTPSRITFHGRISKYRKLHSRNARYFMPQILWSSNESNCVPINWKPTFSWNEREAIFTIATSQNWSIVEISINSFSDFYFELSTNSDIFLF